MAIHNQKNAEPSGPEKEKKPAEKPGGTGSDDICRCKEVAVMKPRKLFGLMISDLAFWKKAKKG
ncbi:MAG TPA: hypothetical protein VL087_10275 [Nitrospirota bacterium]|nr:hypothetical protein [Nitrospirota bacterium]